MKIRTDFVTNSSSSSFIIGKSDDESATVESVFSIVKDLYKEYLCKRDDLVEYIKNNPKLKLKYGQGKHWGDLYWFDISDDKMSWNKKEQIWKSIERDFGISKFDWFEETCEWLNCRTYDDYEKYWVNKMQEANNYKVHAPFTIIDLSGSRPIKCLHINDKTGKYDGDLLRSSVFSWYCEENAHYVSKTKKIPLDEVYVSMLGRVCIYSESGYMPDYIVDRLFDISEYGCGHMG